MICELWVRGSSENQGVVYADVLVSAWTAGRPFPVLTVIPQNDPRGFTRYSANPPWQYDIAGWYQYPEFYTKGACELNPTYDCINGGCVQKGTYNTPGVFDSLAACQSGCAKNSNCTGECVPADEIANLQQALNNLQSKFCK
jgi:hypothetical protein